MRVGILGCDSSHAEEYTALINLFGFGTVDFLWDPDKQTLKSKQNLIGAKYATTELPPVLQDLDLILIEGRYADSHFRPASIAIESQIPTYIDKPTCASTCEFKTLYNLAEKLDVPLNSFSPVTRDSAFQNFKKLQVNAEHLIINCSAYCSSIFDPRAKNLSFYGSHGTDMISSLLPLPYENIVFSMNAISLTAKLKYKDKSGTINFLLHAEEIYEVFAASNKKETIHGISIDPYGDMYPQTIKFLFQEWNKTSFSPEILYPAKYSMQILEKACKYIDDHKKD